MTVRTGSLFALQKPGWRSPEDAASLPVSSGRHFPLLFFPANLSFPLLNLSPSGAWANSYGPLHPPGSVLASGPRPSFMGDLLLVSAPVTTWETSVPTLMIPPLSHPAAWPPFLTSSAPVACPHLVLATLCRSSCPDWDGNCKTKHLTLSLNTPKLLCQSGTPSLSVLQNCGPHHLLPTFRWLLSVARTSWFPPVINQAPLVLLPHCTSRGNPHQPQLESPRCLGLFSQLFQSGTGRTLITLGTACLRWTSVPRLRTLLESFHPL